MELYEKKLTSKQIFDGKVVKLFVDTVELPDGSEAIREIVRHPGAVCVIPVTKDMDVVTVKQYRYAFEQIMLEIPAGKLEPGENPLEAVKRELEEESGVVAGKIEYLGEIFTTVAIFDEKIHLYLATELEFKDAHPDEDEFLEVETIPLSELYNMVMDGDIKDAKTQIAILKAYNIIYKS
jgi:ADP-ribose pyrophosphatase